MGFQTCRLNTRLWFTNTLCFYLCRTIWATVNVDIGGDTNIDIDVLIGIGIDLAFMYQISMIN